MPHNAETCDEYNMAIITLDNNPGVNPKRKSHSASHTDMASLSQQCCLQLQILVLMQDNAG